MLTYHQATETLLARPLRASPAATALLDQRERLLGVHFPAAVREWYALDGAVAILNEAGNPDPMVPLADLGAVEQGYAGQPDQDLVTEGLLVIMYENQYNCRWAVRLDGSDDPPVVVQEDQPDGPWPVYADRFSTFVYTRVWDWQTSLQEGQCRLLTGDVALAPTTLPMLREHYQEGPRTFAWPSPLTYRFTSGDGRKRILLWDSPGRKADWFLWAADKAALRELAESVWGIGHLAENLYAVENDCGAEVLEALGRADAWSGVWPSEEQEFWFDEEPDPET